jgi:hypothetical protein
VHEFENCDTDVAVNPAPSNTVFLVDQPRSQAGDDIPRIEPMSL